jgi:hypothetical protein
VDHFDIYDGPEHDALVVDHLDFLHRHLLADRVGRPNEGGAR